MHHRIHAHVRHALLTALCAMSWLTAAAAQTPDDNDLQMLDFGLACASEYDSAAARDRGETFLSPKSRPDQPLAQPPYPPIARRMNAEGTVVMNLLITTDGRVSQAQVHRSSGYQGLDAAALEGTRNWQLEPGQVDGTPRCMRGLFAVTFTLTDYPSETLTPITPSTDALALAELILGLDNIIAILKGSQANASPAERTSMDILTRALREQPQWERSHERAARILTLEFSPEELHELVLIQSTPVFRKLRALSLRLAPELGQLSAQLARQLQCTVGLLGQSSQEQNISLSLPNVPLAPEHETAVEAFATQAHTYCGCVMEQIKQHRTSDQQAIAEHCKEPPRLTLPATAPGTPETP